MGDAKKKNKSDNLIESAMQELDSEESLMQFDSETPETMGIEHAFSGGSKGKDDESENALELDLEPPVGFEMEGLNSPAEDMIFENNQDQEQPMEVNEFHFPEPQASEDQALAPQSPEYNAPPAPEPPTESNLRTAIVSSQTVKNEIPKPIHSENSKTESTVVVNSSSKRNQESFENSDIANTKDVFGVANPFSGVPAVLSASLSENQVIQAENLKIAQNKITEMEKDLEFLRAENESLSSSATFAREQMNEMSEKLQRLEVEKTASTQQYQSEIAIYKDTINSKDYELNKLRQKISEMDGRLQKDLRKVRVRERELENRLELLKLEKNALLKSKDETILDLKSKVDQLSHDANRSQKQVKELNDTLHERHEQMLRTTRSLRLALTSLEVGDSPKTTSVTPLKKAK
jgi:hypothetical protein